MLRRRPNEGSNKVKGVLAAFWIVLAAVSGLYLFTLFTNPAAFGGQTAGLGSSASGSSLTAEQLSDMLAARDKELAEIKQTLHELSQQVAELTGHKQAEAQAAAPAAAPAQAETAAEAPAPKKPEAMAAAPAITPPPPPEKPEPEVKPAEAKAPEKPAAPEPAVAAAEAKPADPKPADAKPEPNGAPPPVAASEAGSSDSGAKSKIPPPVTVSEAEVPPVQGSQANGGASSPAPSQAPSGTADAAAGSPAPTGPAAETASLDPVALPPAANDGTTRYGIEIGTVAKQDALRPLWRTFLTNHAALVAGLQPRRVLAPDKKWRLIAGPFASAAEANQACALFKKASQPCEATVYAGDSL